MITEFYDGRTVLITGATGFLGQGVVAKILRDLPAVRRIYALIRPRRQPGGVLLSAQERLHEELLMADVFDRFRREDPTGFAAAGAKVVAVSGDMTAPGLGLQPEVREQLRDEVDLVISVAATVTFDEPLDQSIRLNTLGPLELLRFATSCPRDPVFVQVSTAYVNGRLSGPIPEELLPADRDIRQLIEGRRGPGFDPEAEIADGQAFCARVDAEAAGEPLRQRLRREILAESRSHRPSERRLTQLVEDRVRRWRERALVAEGMRRAKAHGWNDVYTFTKAMGEQMLVRHRGRLRLVILRPSVVESSLEDPEPGWIFGLKVTDPLIVAYGRGMVPDFPVRADVAMDLVPVDLVVNAILASATQAERDQVRVFQAATSAENPLLAAQIYTYIRQYFGENPMRGRDGRIPELSEWRFSSVRRFRLRFLLGYLYPLRVQQWLLDRLPESLAPTARKRRLAALEKRLRRVLYFTELFTPYTTLNCRFEATRVLALYASLPPDEQRRFNMDVRRIDWRTYYQRVHLPGLRRHVLKEGGQDESLLLESPEEPGAEEERWRTEQGIRTLPDLLRWAATRHAARPALQQERPGRSTSWTYAELQERVEGIARCWHRCGVGAGNRLLLCGEGGPEWTAACLAGALLGAPVVPLDHRLSDAELLELAALVEARALILPGERLTRLTANGPIPSPTEAGPVLLFDLDRQGQPVGIPVPGETATGAWTPPEVEPEAPAMILFSVGPLDQQRGAVLTHAGLVAAGLALAEVHRLIDADRVCCALPPHQGLALAGGLLLPLLGGAAVTHADPSLGPAALNRDPKEAATVVLAGAELLEPAAVAARQPEAGLWTAGLAALRGARLVLAGEDLAGSSAEALRGVGVSLCQTYGPVEGGLVVAANQPDGVRCGSVGQPLPGFEISVRGPDAQGWGEVLVRGPGLMSGYLGRPDLTVQVLVDGWVQTGDRGRLDPDGHLLLASGPRLARPEAGLASAGPEASVAAPPGATSQPPGHLLRAILWGPASRLFARCFSLRAEGLEHLPQDRPYLIAANHTSHLDAVAVMVAVRPYVAQCTVIAAEDYLRRSRVKAWLIRNLIGAEPFDRYGDFRESLARARALVGVRRPLLVFPEGTRSLSGHLQTFKPGIGLLSVELDLPIVPVHVDGTGQALPRGHRWPHRVPIHLSFGPPLEPGSGGSSVAGRYESYRALAEQVRRAVESLAPARP
ncbi:MAG: SDR family oxidoreductase [Candidatus Latescibacterota bacterium]|jgi:long-chain acyl-CoA synthetase